MDLLKDVVKSIDDAKVRDIRIYETKSITPFFDYVIIATAGSSRQLNAVVHHLEKDSEEKDIDIKGVEGTNGGYWVLIDLNDILVNIFLKEEREKYDLDKLWKDLPQVDAEDLLHKYKLE